MAIDRSLKWYLGSNSDDGIVMGLAATDLLGFYGHSVIAQQTVTTIGTTTISQVGTTGKWAFASSTAAIAFVARLRSVQSALKNLGLIA